MTSVALGEYRRGRFDRAEFWARKCLATSTGNESRVATARILLALALQQQGHTVEAHSELEPASKMVKEKFHNDQRLEENAGDWWPDWLIARILLREAESFVPTASSAR